MKRLFNSIFLGILTLVISAEEEPPGFAPLRFDEEAAAYEPWANSSTPWYRIRYIPLGPESQSFLSIGGEIRQRYDYFVNPDFGGAPFDHSDAWLHRYTLHFDYSWSPRVRAFLQFYGSFADDREGGPSPVDENGAEVQNAFVDFYLGKESPRNIMLRAGRQELNYGSGRLIDAREGPNVRRTFNAGLVRFENDCWRVDAFYAVPLSPETGNFNDDADPDEESWGLYTTKQAPSLGGSFDYYYIGYKNRDANYLGTIGEELRHSVGVRYAGESAGWDWNLESLYQFGEFADLDIQAWTVASRFGHTFDGIPWNPRLGLSTNIASGDSNPGDGQLGTFNAIFPRGNYFSEAAILGPRNFFNVHPSIAMHPTDQLSLTLDSNFFWRLEETDGVYGPPGQLIRGPGGSDEHFVTQTVSFNATYQFSRELSMGFIYTHLFTGDFLEATGPSEDIDFFEFTITCKF